jgi:hypothetical protein
MGNRRSFRTGSFDAESATEGAVTAWLRNSTLSGNIESDSDLLNTNPAIQTVDARRPSGNADGSMTWADNPDNLVWPVHASNNGVTKTGFAFWFDPDTVATNYNLIQIGAVAGGASAAKWDIQQNSTRLVLIVYDPDAVGTGRIAQAPVAGLVAGPQFVTVEFDGDAATEATEIVMTINASDPLTLAFSNLGSPTVPIDSLPVVTGNIIIGNGQNAAGGSAPLVGRFGRNIYALGAKMTGATTGLLTAAARTALMNFEPLV